MNSTLINDTAEGFTLELTESPRRLYLACTFDIQFIEEPEIFFQVVGRSLSDFRTELSVNQIY